MEGTNMFFNLSKLSKSKNKNDLDIIINLAIDNEKSDRYDIAIPLYKVGVEKGDRQAMCRLANIYVNIYPTQDNYMKAIALYNRVLKLDTNKDPQVMNLLANVYSKINNSKRAMELYEKAVELKYIPALYNLVQLCNEIGVFSDKIDYLCNKALILEDSDTMSLIGCHLENTNVEKAIELYEKSLKLNKFYNDEYITIMSLASLYKNQGLYEKSIATYRIGIESGYNEANIALGEMYENGNGISQDYKIALELYSKIDYKIGIYRTQARYNYQKYQENIKKIKSDSEYYYTITSILKDYETAIDCGATSILDEYTLICQNSNNEDHIHHNLKKWVCNTRYVKVDWSRTVHKYIYGAINRDTFMNKCIITLLLICKYRNHSIYPETKYVSKPLMMLIIDYLCAFDIRDTKTYCNDCNYYCNECGENHSCDDVTVRQCLFDDDSSFGHYDD
jgi:TPR repeat protein